MDALQLCPVVLAGGSGTRLWPLSREGYPKQLLRVTGDHTLLQETLLRLDGLQAPAGRRLELLAPVVVCSEELRFLVLEQLEALGRPAGRVLLEPAARNTAPALTLAARSAAAGGGDPVLLAMPADHVIADRAAFHQAVRTGMDLAAAGTVVTFGVVPDRPETGYGYIERGAPLGSAIDAAACAVAAFAEKPEPARAAEFLASGRYLWNSGIFAMRASVWLAAIERCRPDIARACAAAWEAGAADGDFYRPGRATFERCPAESIDYAVMERLGETGGNAAAVVPLAAGWSDVGSWPAILALHPAGKDGNVLQGDVHARHTRDSLVIANHRLVAAVGLREAIVVETADAVLVADRARSQEVREVVAWLNAGGRDEGRSHRRVHRPWGSYEPLDAGERYQVKRLTVKPGAELSLQMHHHRAEHWVVVRGTARVVRGEEEFLLTENESTYIPIGTRHRLANPGTVPLEVIEVQSGSYLGEDDIVRFEDRYDRHTQG